MSLNSSASTAQDFNEHDNSTALMTTTFSDYDDFFGGSGLQTTKQIELYGCLLLMPLGFILNTASFVIFIVTKTYKTPTGLHLLCISVADNTVLISIFLMRSPNWTDYINVRLPITATFCKTTVFLSTFSFLWSGVLLASATIERFLSIAFTLQVKVWNLFRITKFLLFIHAIISISLASIFAYFTDATKFGKEMMCFSKSQYIEIFKILDQIINTIFANGICAGLIFVFTVLIAIFLYSYKRKRNGLSQDVTNTSDKEFQITLMLFTVACLFIFTRIPEIVTYQLGYHCFSKMIHSQMCHYFSVFWPLSSLLVVVNHSVYFFIYTIFFKSFRGSCCERKAKTYSGENISHCRY